MVTWLNRGTLHLVRAEDYRWLHRLTAHRVLPGVRTRLRGLGVGAGDEEHGVAVVVGALSDEGPLNRLQLRDRLDAAGVPTAGQALVHVLAAASLQGLVVRGPVVDGQHAFVAVEPWLGRRSRRASRDDDSRPTGPAVPGRPRPGHTRRPRRVGGCHPRRRTTCHRRDRQRPPRGRGRCGAGRPSTPGDRSTACPPARAVRSRAARMGLEGAVRGATRLGSDDQRDLPGVLPGGRPGGRDLDPSRGVAPSSTCSRRSTTPTWRHSPPTPGTSCGSSAIPAVRLRSPVTTGDPRR